MATAYFFSDAHLGLGSREEERKKESRLLSFLDHIQKDANQLFIVGDLFDAWFEYRTVIPKGFHRIITKLEDLLHNNIEIHYLAGNHDYWQMSFFRDELGVIFHKDSYETVIDSKKFLIHHGDGFEKNDRGYRIFKKILRNPLNISLYSWIHPDIGIRLARFFSKRSRKFNSVKLQSKNEGIIKFATEKIGSGFDYIIMGHYHQPDVKQIGNGVYINLGDWITHSSYVVAVNGTVELKFWLQ